MMHAISQPPAHSTFSGTIAVANPKTAIDKGYNSAESTLYKNLWERAEQLSQNNDNPEIQANRFKNEEDNTDFFMIHFTKGNQEEEKFMSICAQGFEDQKGRSSKPYRKKIRKSNVKPEQSNAFVLYAPGIHLPKEGLKVTEEHSLFNALKPVIQNEIKTTLYSEENSTNDFLRFLGDAVKASHTRSLDHIAETLQGVLELVKNAKTTHEWTAIDS